MNEKVKFVGYFVVGDGQRGEKEMGDTFASGKESSAYWTNRGYDLVEVFVPESTVL